MHPSGWWLGARRHGGAGQQQCLVRRRRMPAAQVMERSIGVLAGVMRADAAPPSSDADALLASRLAARAFSSGDVGQFDQLMAAGTRANLADNPGAAETAFRAALALQQKALGKDNPNTVTAMMSLALQLSNEGRYAEAEALFNDAIKLAPGAADTTARARLLHYRGLDAMNQGQLEQALTLLTQADAAYATDTPTDALAARPQVLHSTNVFSRGGQTRLSDLMPNANLLSDPDLAIGAARVDRSAALSCRRAAHHGTCAGGRRNTQIGDRAGTRQWPRAADRQCETVSYRCGDGCGAGPGRPGVDRSRAGGGGVRSFTARLETAGRHQSAARAATGEGRPDRCGVDDLPQRRAVAGVVEGWHHADTDGALPGRLCRCRRASE